MKKTGMTKTQTQDPVLPPIWKEEDIREDAELARAALIQRRSAAIKNELAGLNQSFPVNVSAIEEALRCLMDCHNANYDAKVCQTHLLKYMEDDKSGLKKEGLRYLAYPPISNDDLEATAEISSFTRKTIEAKADPKDPDYQPDPNAAKRVMETIRDALDPVRWGWLTDPASFAGANDPAAVAAGKAYGLKSTALMLASSKTQASRRSTEKSELESQVHDILIAAGFVELPKKSIKNSSQLHGALQPGQFMKECNVVSENADFVICLKDGRFLFIECKASNSEINSRKRLNKEATKNIKVWQEKIGSSIVGSCSIRGIFKPEYVLEAQRQGVYIFWAHKLEVLAKFLREAV